jgi:hypothetical protein
LGKERGDDMELSRNVILLESNLYERSAIISSIEQNSKTDKLSEVNTNLQSLISRASTEIQNRIELESESSESSETILKEISKGRDYNQLETEYGAFGLGNTLGNLTRTNNGVETLVDARWRLENEGKIFFMREKINSQNEKSKSNKDYMWNLQHEDNEFELHRTQYLDYFITQELGARNKAIGFYLATTMLIFLFTFEKNIGILLSATFHILLWWNILFLLLSPLVKRFRVKLEIERRRAKMIELSFQKFDKSLSKDLENIRHLSLGQFFQPGDYLFRFVGYVSGNGGNVLMLRKRMRGSSSIVPDYIDRFSQAALVAITIEEFVDLYTGKDIEKDDHRWANVIIKPNESWND